MTALMTYFYVSCWKRQEDGRLHPAGVLAVGDGKAAAHFPADADEQADWSEIAEGINGQSGFFSITPPRVWLNQVAQRGNGLTEEYSEVSQLQAETMSNALDMAFHLADSAQHSPGSLTTVEVRDFYDFGNPLAPLLPDSLLRPGRVPVEAARQPRPFSPVQRPATQRAVQSAFREGDITLTKMAGLPVAATEARVVEEVVVGKTASDRVETVSDTIRRTDVEEGDEATHAHQETHRRR